MADPTAPRVEPIMDPGPTPMSAEVHAVEPQPAPAPVLGRTSGVGSDSESLMRIEEKAARIEEKYARSEALLQRVEAKVDAATGRMSEAARQADLTAVREQVTAMGRTVRGLPGLTSLVAVAIVTSLLTAAIVLAVMKYGIPGIPGFAPR